MRENKMGERGVSIVRKYELFNNCNSFDSCFGWILTGRNSLNNSLNYLK